MAGDSDPDKWDYPPHTRAKHEILRNYLGGWYAKLASFSGRILFFDGFAGRGRYASGEEGSPIIALRCLLDHTAFGRWRDKEFIFYFVEADRANSDSLEATLSDLRVRYSPWPENVKVHVLNATFDDTARNILEVLRDQRKRMAPVFAFVDPFGYRGLSMRTLAEFLAYPQAEVFINFMVGHVQRFITRDGQERVMKDLFGMDVADILADYDAGSRARVEHLRDVYASQLRDVVRFPHVRSFAMINKTGNIGYYLLHGTRHPDGVELMKDAVWKVDPGGGATVSDRLAGVDVLFVPAPDLAPLRSAILERFSGRNRVSPDEIRRFVVLDTLYRRPHATAVLRNLEDSGKITVVRPARGRRGAYPETATIDFSS